MAESTNTQPIAAPEALAQAPASEGKADYDAIFAKLDAILDKRSDGIARSALKDNGIAEDEVKEDCGSVPAAEGGERSEAERDPITALEAENQTLKEQLLRGRLQAEAMTQAATLQVSPDTVPYLLKLADLSGAVDEEGEISKDAVTEALNKVLADIPALKQTKEQAKGFIPIGGGGQDRQSAELEERQRRWFGLPPKK